MLQVESIIRAWMLYVTFCERADVEPTSSVAWRAWQAVVPWHWWQVKRAPHSRFVSKFPRPYPAEAMLAAFMSYVRQFRDYDDATASAQRAVATTVQRTAECRVGTIRNMVYGSTLGHYCTVADRGGWQTYVQLAGDNPACAPDRYRAKRGHIRGVRAYFAGHVD
jgi:hypothetical protein